MLKDIEPVWAGYSQGRNVDLGGLIVSDLRFPAGLRLSPHEHEVATIGVTLARWLRCALDYIHAHATDSIGLAEVAREAGVHPVYFARAFRAQTGLPVGAYLRKLRVDQAAEKLASTNLSIADIALAAGFSDQSHLTRVFRALTGVTPATYRQRRRS